VPGPTVTVSGITLCPTRTVNPTYAPPTPLPTNYLWGCPPGKLCQPQQELSNGRCNFEVGPPRRGYVCSPDQCKPTPPLLPPQNWGPPVYGKQIDKFVVSPGYFNFDPRKFGLEWDIFAFQEAPRYPTLRARQALIAPPVCFEDCNNALLEAEASGLTPSLCFADSAFRIHLGRCQTCIDANSDNAPEIWANVILPDFQQFLGYCDTLPQESTTPPATQVSPTPSETQPPATTPPVPTSEPPVPTSNGVPETTNTPGTEVVPPPGSTDTSSGTASPPPSEPSSSSVPEGEGDGEGEGEEDEENPTAVSPVSPTGGPGSEPESPGGPGETPASPTDTSAPPVEFPGAAHSILPGSWHTAAAGVALLVLLL
jgi:hypothetical protein